MKSCTSGPGTAKPDGMTPTTRNDRRSSVSVRPTTPGSAPKRFSQRRWESTTTGSAPTGAAAVLKREAAVSSGVKVRPRAALTPISGKKSSVTWEVRTTSDSPPEVRVRPIV